MLPGELTDTECRIVTERLVLRRLRADDAPRMAELANNWNMARTLSRMPHPYSLSDAETFIARQSGSGRAMDSLGLAVTLADQFVGMASLFPHEGAGLEMGYWIGEPYWNRGFMSEAARALVDFGFERLDLPVIVAGHYVDNHASGRVLSKLGFRYTGESLRRSLAQGRDVRCLDMRLDRQRWLELRHTRARVAATA
jgi:ribosomal-protein-alanine N-acetyltransferase